MGLLRTLFDAGVMTYRKQRLNPVALEKVADRARNRAIGLVGYADKLPPEMKDEFIEKLDLLCKDIRYIEAKLQNDPSMEPNEMLDEGPFEVGEQYR